ncbi:MAG: hybrid sensor histidine kinase/response regulator [Burkholderiales bacterium RIFCSPHIGHO2_12_FULL_65_48]|nr:MAG: hybrid sensor histidine kinase/response regulator [Burkholderiales bacterium RIFCSPHIGHO2_02_FULL_64_19]OGB21651.1 MAG: hybrid sensor histidine kinase/response regulator [Burkholderiales bacterium RIFCSPHIGHO2_12_FULL_65_48]OGB55335.1 MAG: hybrid sensor histidine kinase/response regulator [Burkholderiales bacterium RIFCSPLOWO2_12_FULL_64_33]
MSEPDLSFLDPAGRQPAPTGHAPGTPTPRATPPSTGAEGLVAELRAYQAELESQNKVLRYSQTVAESAYERFETLFASVPLALMVVDEHDMVVQANSMAHRSFQPTERDRPLTALMPFVRPQDARRVREAFALAQDLGRSEVKEVVFSINADTPITGDLHIAHIEAPQSSGPPLSQFLCAVIDQGPLLAERQALQHSAITLQQRNEQIRASEKRLEAIINSALDAIICVDQHQRITVFNPTAAALFQCSASDALGSTLDRFLPDAAQALAFAQLTTQALLGEMTALTASGKELAVEVSVSFERHAEGETTTVFARDLTGRKKAEAHRSELEAQLRESHKMQAVGTMAGGIAHDFNNILGAILGNVELAKADCAAGSPVLESLMEIDKAGRRARDLVRQILTFSRNEPPQRSAVSLAEVVHDTERLLRVTLPPAIELHMQLQAGLPPVLADATQVEQALLNLCTNAVHAIQSQGTERGSIHVEAAAVQPDQRLSERLGLAPVDYVALTVRDSGPGMDAATLERIFEPFFTTKPVGQGTGLGLAVVHGVMRTHEGGVDVHSAPGQGSRFTLYFPVAHSAAQSTLDAQPTQAVQAAPASSAPSTPHATDTLGSAPRKKHHVMYVDDDQALVFLVQRLLRRRGYEVSGYTDPHEATAALRAAPQAFDLLVTDYNMPGFCGVDLVREARLIRPDLPVALASGYVTAEIEQAALAEGAQALIHKPNDVEELCATVQRLVGGDSHAAG